MDEVGALAAMRFAGESCVTASIDQMEFEQPIPVDDTAVIRGYVYDAGETSVDVKLEAYREAPAPASPSSPPGRTSSSSPSTSRGIPSPFPA